MKIKIKCEYIYTYLVTDQLGSYVVLVTWVCHSVLAEQRGRSTVADTYLLREGYCRLIPLWYVGSWAVVWSAMLHIKAVTPEVPGTYIYVAPLRWRGSHSWPITSWACNPNHGNWKDRSASGRYPKLLCLWSPTMVLWVIPRYISTYSMLSN